VKICQVVATSKELGGLERHVADLSSALAEQHEVHVIGDPLLEPMLYGNVIFHPTTMKASRRNPLFRWHLTKAIQRLGPDIIHAQANKAAALVGNLRFTKVATIHNTKRSAVAFSKFDHVIAVSHTAAEGITGAPFEVIHNGIRPIVHSPTAQSLPPRKHPDLPLLLAVGRLVEAKGFDLLIPAMNDVNAELWIAGEGPERSRLESLVQTDQVSLLGNRSDVSLLTREADLAVISSRNEGFPYTLVEFLHHRIPVVSTTISGVDQFLPADYLVRIPEPDSLATTINQALTQQRSLPMAFESAFQFATNELTLKRMTERTLQVYSELLART
jgi:glycosyltransferase involved in cell wall biosynthesis